MQRQRIKPDNPAYPTMRLLMTKTGAEEISLQQLRALAAVAESGSFTLAAEALQLTQPAISHLIKRMEHELGQPLVVRGRRIRMTNAGEMMVDTAVRALRLIDESVDACRSQSQLREGRVVLAVGHLTAGALLPPLLSRFSQQHPGAGDRAAGQHGRADDFAHPVAGGRPGLRLGHRPEAFGTRDRAALQRAHGASSCATTIRWRSAW